MKKALIALMALALVAAFAMPAAAAEKSEVSFGGYVAFDTWVVDADEPTLDMDGDGVFDDGAYDDTDLIWQQDPICSRFNASFKRENFTGFVEIRPRTDSGSNQEAQIRHFYAEWNFGPGYLLIGQTWAPSFMPISSSVGPYGGGCSGDAGDTGYGSGRDPMIRLRFPFSIGQFQLAFMDPTQGGSRNIPDDGVLGNVSDDEDYMLPRVEARLGLNFGPVAFNICGGWLEYEEVYRNQDLDNDLDETEFDVEAWIAAANIKFTGGPFSIAMSGWVGENPMEYGYFGGTERGSGAQVLMPTAWIEDRDGDCIFETSADVDAWGAYISATFKLNDMVSFAAGGGTREFEGDYDGLTITDETTHYYVNATITLAEGFTITPEIGEYDYDTTDFDTPGNSVSQDEGDDFYYGIWWKMNF
jgi:hypothetical protein